VITLDSVGKTFKTRRGGHVQALSDVAESSFA